MLVEIVIHDETVGHPNSVRLHGMPCDVRIVANICIVEVGHPLVCTVRTSSIDGGEASHGVTQLMGMLLTEADG